MADISHQVPEWEAAPPKKSIFSKFTTQSPPSYTKEAPGEDATTVKPTFSDRYLPHRAAWLGRSRKSRLLIIAALIILVALILGLGLGFGLAHKSLVTLDSFHHGVLP